MSMSVVQPAFKTAEPPFGAEVSRQLSAWPFAARTTRLFLLVDPSLPDQSLRQGLLRAMQQAYFRSDGLSQTRAVREAALAAHYVLRHHNRDALAPEQVNAASAVAALRGETAFVALAGDAAAFAWTDGVLTGQRGILRLPRPLGLEQDPRITLWSTPIAAGDRLALVCGATWRQDCSSVIEGILRNTDSGDNAEQQLADALGGSRPAGVLVASHSRSRRSEPHLTLVPPAQRAPRPAPAQATRVHAGVLPRSHRLLALLGLLVLAVVAATTLNQPPQSTPLEKVQQARALLAEAGQTVDVYQAHALAASALDLARNASTMARDDVAEPVASDAARALDQIDRVYPVSPAMAVRLGPAGGNVVDLAVGDDALYTLDVVEASIRAFPLDALDQQPTPDTLVARTGTPIGARGRRLATPVAIQYLNGPRPGAGSLAIVDQARSVVQVARDRALSIRTVPSSATWRELGALGSDPSGDLYVLDSGARRLLQYPPISQRVVDPPRVLLDGAGEAGAIFARATHMVGNVDQVFLRLDDGTVNRVDTRGSLMAIIVRPPDDRSTSVSAITSDGAGGLYLADPGHARILHVSEDGAFVRQFSDPALAGLRDIQSSPDGRRLYGLVASGVLVFDIPPLL